jgi:hypothetical protein
MPRACRSCGVEVAKGENYCPIHKPSKKKDDGGGDNGGAKNTNKKRGENRNQSFGGESHTKQPKGGKNQTNFRGGGGR